MNLVHRERSTPEFKAQAIELLSTGKPVSQVAEELCMSSNLLYGWRHRAPGAHGHPVGGSPDRRPDRGHLPAPAPPRWLSANRRGTLRCGRGLRAGSHPQDHAPARPARQPAQNLRAQNQRWPTNLLPTCSSASLCRPGPTRSGPMTFASALRRCPAGKGSALWLSRSARLLHPHLRRLALSGRGDRSLLAQDRWLIPGR